jgi:phage-related protein
MSTFTDTPGSAALTTKPRVRTAAFGDGYEQRLADGINNAPRSWSLGFTRPTAEADAILAFFEARNGAEAFDWTPPYGAAGRWVARDWSAQMISMVAKSINVTFEEVFGA